GQLIEGLSHCWPLWSTYCPRPVKGLHQRDFKMVSGNHSQRQDVHGFISRSFTRTYVLPVGVDPLLLFVDLSHDGILSVSAPRTTPDPPSTHTHVIHTHTDKTA
uniref:SHSP domain-containing protein n=1 Tax=Hucho hucho TaxID=62062 RepID=A0A4W5JST8_9TELE